MDSVLRPCVTCGVGVGVKSEGFSWAVVRGQGKGRSLKHEGMYRYLSADVSCSKRSNFITKLTQDKKQGLVLRLTHLAEVGAVTDGQQGAGTGREGSSGRASEGCDDG